MRFERHKHNSAKGAKKSAIATVQPPRITVIQPGH